jgi:hypothetical protein
LYLQHLNDQHVQKELKQLNEVKLPIDKKLKNELLNLFSRNCSTILTIRWSKSTRISSDWLWQTRWRWSWIRSNRICKFNYWNFRLRKKITTFLHLAWWLWPWSSIWS